MLAKREKDREEKRTRIWLKLSRTTTPPLELRIGTSSWLWGFQKRSVLGTGKKRQLRFGRWQFDGGGDIRFASAWPSRDTKPYLENLLSTIVGL
jgi:hypothetical protein